MHHPAWLCRIAIPPGLLLAVALMAMAAAPLSVSQAAPLAAPQGEVLLRVAGNIAATNNGDELHLDREQLMAIDTQVIETSTPWTEGVNRFEGPLFRSVLEAAGARGEHVRVRTLNDYTVDISLSELQQYDVILALQQDGVPLEVRELGPVFVLYPFDEHPELFNQSVRHRSAWHVISVEVL